jgi:cation:H+ antiporter
MVFILLSVKFIKNEDLDESNANVMTFVKSFFFFILGSAGLYFGSDFFVNNSVYIAKELGVSEFIIGITIVAFGTSLPELVTSIVAAVRNQNSISIGNLIGSNIFNVFAVLGLTALIKPLIVISGSSNITIISLAVMLFFAIIMGVYLTRKKISRLKGMALVIGYLIYIGFSIFI